VKKVAHAAVAVAKAAYKYSGAQDVVSCVTNPHLSSCIKAAVTVALVVATAGEGEVEVAAMNAAEEAGGSLAEEEGITSLYRVSPTARGSSELDNGLHSANFPRNDDLDGSAYFGNETRTREFAATHAESHDVGFRVDVPTRWLRSNNIEPMEGLTERHLEYSIPRELFGEFNQFARHPWNPWK
jgi:hypothetical protein